MPILQTVRNIWARSWIKVASYGAVFALFLRLFDWRNCAVTRTTPDLANFFVPPDAWARFYGATELRALFEPIAQSGRSLYALTQVTLDVAFPVFYVLALVLALRWVFPAGHRYRMLAHVLPFGAGAADLLENVVTGWVAWQGSYGVVIGAMAGVFTAAKWLLLMLSLLLLAIGYIVLHTGRTRRLLQHLFFVRIPLLLGLLVFALSVLGQRQQCDAPSAKPVGLATVQNLLSVDNTIQFGFAVYCAFIACAVIIFAGTHLWRLAQKRINIEKLGLSPQAPDQFETRLLFGLSAFALALPLLLQLGIDGEGSRSLGYLAGIAAAVATLLIVYVLRNVLLGRFTTRITDTAFKQLRKTAASQVEAPVSRTLHRLVGPGFDICDEHGNPTGRLYRGHALAAAVALALAVGYAIGGRVLNPIRELPTLLDVPPIAYVMLLIAFICMLFSNLTFLLDRIRVPVVLAFAVWLLFWGNLPGVWYNTQHYFDVTFVPEGRDAPPSIERAFAARASRAGDGPIVVVAAAGGGIQAAGWSAVVLEGLHRQLGRDFTDSIYLVSATSGGSVGAYFFIEALRADALAREDAGLSAPAGPRRDKYVGFSSITQSELAEVRSERGLQYLDQVPKAAMASSLEATAWGLVFPDLQRLATPFLVGDNPKRTALDRAWAIEQAWHRWRSCMVTDTTVYFDDMEKNPDCRRPLAESPPPARLSDWWRRANEGVLPGVILNGTVIENGEQFLASSLDLRTLDLSREDRARFAATDRWTLGEFDPALCEHYPPPPDTSRRVSTTSKRRAKSGTDMSAPDPCASPMRFVDMRAVTAARLSATFPYVTPVARARIRRDDSDYEGGTNLTPDDGPRVETPPWHVGDGGYFDNPGSVAVFRWIEAVREIETRRGRASQRPILFIQINPFPARPARSVPAEGQGWQASLLGPLTGMLSVRTSSQLARSDLELSMLEAVRGPCFEAVEFRPPYVSNRADPPLSWELSRADRERLFDDWRHARNQATVNYLQRTYFNGRAARCGP